MSVQGENSTSSTMPVIPLMVQHPHAGRGKKSAADPPVPPFNQALSNFPSRLRKDVIDHGLRYLSMRLFGDARDVELLNIAYDSLMAYHRKLPLGWNVDYSADGTPYYWHESWDFEDTQWDHPATARYSRIMRNRYQGLLMDGNPDEGKEPHRNPSRMAKQNFAGATSKYLGTKHNSSGYEHNEDGNDDEEQEQEQDFDLANAPNVGPSLRRHNSHDRAEQSPNLFASIDSADKPISEREAVQALKEERRKRHELEQQLQKLGGKLDERNFPIEEEYMHCCICMDKFARSKGILCSKVDPCFTCRDCLDAYVTEACLEGGRFMLEISKKTQKSACGELPCPNFGIPLSDCNGAALPEREVYHLLSQNEAQNSFEENNIPTNLSQISGLESYLRAMKLLAVKEYMQGEDDYRNRGQNKDTTFPEDVQAMESSLVVRSNAEAQLACKLIEEALLLGLTQTCPGCGLKSRKDDACIHMTCSCGQHFCYVCGGGASGCQCDSRSIYLQSMPMDWGLEEFEQVCINRLVEQSGTNEVQESDPTRAYMALVWFHLRRCAFMIYVLKTSVIPPVTWNAAMQHSPGILSDLYDGFGLEHVPDRFHSQHPPAPVRWERSVMHMRATLTNIQNRAVRQFRDKWGVIRKRKEEMQLGGDNVLLDTILSVTCPQQHGLLVREISMDGQPRRLRCSLCQRRVRSDRNFGCLECAYFLCDECLEYADKGAMDGGAPIGAQEQSSRGANRRRRGTFIGRRGRNLLNRLFFSTREV